MLKKILGKHICYTQLTSSTWQDNCFRTVWREKEEKAGHKILCQTQPASQQRCWWTIENPSCFLPCHLSNSFRKIKLPRAIKVTCKLQDELRAPLLFLSISDESNIEFLWQLWTRNQSFQDHVFYKAWLTHIHTVDATPPSFRLPAAHPSPHTAHS